MPRLPNANIWDFGSRYLQARHQSCHQSTVSKQQLPGLSLHTLLLTRCWHDSLITGLQMTNVQPAVQPFQSLVISMPPVLLTTYHDQRITITSLNEPAAAVHTSSVYHCSSFSLHCCPRCFDTVGWAVSVKNLSDEVLAWLSVWSEVQMICIWSSWCHCHPVISCFIKIQTGLAFLMLAYPGCPGKETFKWMSVCLSRPQ